MPPEQPFISTEAPISQQEKVHSEPALEREQQARILCQIGNHHAILESFKTSENRLLLEESILRLQSNPTIREQLSDIIPALAPAHWEMLTLLELFDIETFEHCIRTYQILERKLKSTHPVGNFLRAELEKEGVQRETLTIAALLHDVGKIGIPFKDLILNNSLTDSQWHRLCINHFCSLDHCSPEHAEATINEKLASGTEHNLREKDLVPFSLCLTPEQQARLGQSGIDSDQTLGEIINAHQDFSGEIAKAYGLDDTFIALVSNHHERPLNTEDILPVSKSALRIATILRFADVFDAIHSARSYKKGNPFLTTIAILIQKSRDGFIDPKLAFLWIDEDMRIFETSKENYFQMLPEAIDHEHIDEIEYSPATREAIIQKEHTSLQIICTFLKEKLN
ncbi:MAG: HD domain-containing protein [Candidatus Moranbacteria bacterium]|jgi:HD-GYP domain-containing protein (c-di-GMP phosphodiesterase class II)|nr:HD domain-containing protein [Candidatus Moranbacteria bacterium]MBP9801432.1 HD domain-containing protein [Candidatus Moranbacteria bacterium]